MANGLLKTLHYWMLVLKESASSNPCRGSLMTRGTEFEGEPNIETSDWEGHDGSKGIKLASDRTSANAEPQWEQAAMFGEGFEEYWYMLLGSTKGTTGVEPSETIAVTTPEGESINAYKWEFFQDLINVKPLPVATIINGYSALKNDAITYDNAKMSELEMAIDKDGLNLTVTFGSEAPIINQANPVRPVLTELSRLGVNGLEFYIADFGTNLKDLTEEELQNYYYECIVSSNNSFNTNLEDSICIGGEFGRAVKDEGAFESDSSVEIIFTERGSKLIDKWYSGKADGTFITEQLCFQEVLIRGKSRLLGTDGSGNDVYETFNFYLPKVQIDKAWSQLSGDDTKTIEIDYSLVGNGSVSPVEVEIVSKLSALHFGTPQQTRSVQDD